MLLSCPGRRECMLKAVDLRIYEVKESVIERQMIA